jgi:hypothetical protein
MLKEIDNVDLNIQIEEFTNEQDHDASIQKNVLQSSEER